MPDARARTVWTFIVTSLASFMVALDNLVVTTALPQIRDDLGAGLEGLEWTVNAYTLPFAVLLLTGAALGDRLGRRGVFTTGLAVFTLGSLGAALAPSIEALIAARAVQGVGAALVLPLSLTLLSAAVPPDRRGAALGVWGAMSGLAVAVGPLVGGAITEGASWQWIFWLNVPIGAVAVPVALRRLTPSRGPDGRLDLPGVAVISVGLLGVTLGLVRGESHGWTSAVVLASLTAGIAGIVAFVAWELRVARRGGTPMLPMSMFRRRGFAAVNAASLLFSVGMFGSIFLLAQALQNVFGYSPLEAGLRTLPWTAMPLLIAPIAGPLSDRIGGRPLIITSMILEAVSLAWLALVLDTGAGYAGLVAPFVLAGIGMALFFVPIATVALGAVPIEQQGLASGANNAMRELGGVLGIAVLASVFAANGGYTSPAEFVAGTRPALWVGVAALLLAAVGAFLLPSKSAPAPLGGTSAASGNGDTPAVPATPGQDRASRVPRSATDRDTARPASTPTSA